LHADIRPDRDSNECLLLLRRHSRNAARRRLAWPGMPFSCSDNGWTWGTIVLLTVFRKTRQHDQRQIDRAGPDAEGM